MKRSLLIAAMLCAFVLVPRLSGERASAVETAIAVSSTAIDFGQVTVGQTVTASVSLTNTGGTPFGPVNLFGGAPPTQEFNASQNCQSVTLPPGGSCTISYSFTPSAPGPDSDSSNFTVSPTANQADGEDFSVSLSGVGVNPITVSAAAIDFGNVAVGTTPIVPVVVTNIGSTAFGPINMFGGAPPTAEFNASQNCQAVTLPAGGTCTIAYSFTPSATGAFSDSSNFTISATTSQAAGTDFSISLRGTGIGPDTVAPTIVTPANIVRDNDPGQAGAVVTFAPTVSDNLPGVTFACSPPSGYFFPLGTTVVTCTATDASGNTTSASFTVRVNDVEPPTITVPADQDVVRPFGSPNMIVTYPPPTAADNAPGVTVVCVPPSGSYFPQGATTVACTATDTSGNTASGSFTVQLTLLGAIRVHKTERSDRIERPGQGWRFTVSGCGSTVTGVTSAAGDVLFADLESCTYIVQELVVSASWAVSPGESVSVTVADGALSEVTFVNTFVPILTDLLPVATATPTRTPSPTPIRTATLAPTSTTTPAISPPSSGGTVAPLVETPSTGTATAAPASATPRPPSTGDTPRAPSRDDRGVVHLSLAILCMLVGAGVLVGRERGR